MVARIVKHRIRLEMRQQKESSSALLFQVGKRKGRMKGKVGGGRRQEGD
jgi:hypothetical protein